MFTLALNSNVSKGVLLSPVVIYIWKLSLWRESKNIFKKLVVSICITFVSVVFFSILQKIKLGSQSVDLANMNTDRYPWFLKPFLVLSDRFDAFTRVTDAIFAQGQVGGYKTWFLYLLDALNWNPFSGRNESSFGQIWNQFISEKSVRGSRLSSVSTSQGMIGEGYIWSGFSSLIIECIILSFIFVTVGKYLEGNILKVIFGFCLISNFTLFESGLVQFSEILSGSIKILMFLWVLKQFRKVFRGQNELG
jgi:hypothetical protein